MPFAVHNLHSPAVEVDHAGTYSHDGEYRIPAPTPLHVEETRQAAESWRHQQREAGR